jgi:hypothetical protein
VTYNVSKIKIKKNSVTDLEGTFLTMGVMRPLGVATATEMSMLGITCNKNNNFLETNLEIK